MSDTPVMDPTSSNGTSMISQASLAPDTNLTQHNAIFLNPVILLVLAGLVFFLMRTQFWARFASGYKKTARVVLCFMIMILLIPMCGTTGWAVSQLKGKLSPEFPSLTVTAIKIGVYDLELSRQIAMHIPVDQRDLYECVVGLSAAEANEEIKQCKDNDICMRSLLPSTREALMEKIKAMQADPAPHNEQLKACYQVKVL